MKDGSDTLVEFFAIIFGGVYLYGSFNFYVNMLPLLFKLLWGLRESMF
jgi:hypothetical protein